MNPEKIEQALTKAYELHRLGHSARAILFDCLDVIYPEGGRAKLIAYGEFVDAYGHPTVGSVINWLRELRSKCHVSIDPMSF